MAAGLFVDAREAALLSETIVALSSGRPPSGVAVIRVSGTAAGAVAAAFGATGLRPRRAAVRTLRSGGEVLDRALCLWFAAPASATGEDVLELHCHGGPALIDRVLAEAVAVPGVRLAEPGEFTLRAVLAGKMDLTAAEGLADLVEARTEAERRRATRLAGGALADLVAGWRARLVALSAEAEAELDFADEGDVAIRIVRRAPAALALADDIDAALAASASAGKLTDGFDVVLVGPPNAGKSSLLNALAGRDAAIVSPIAGTTRDVVSVTLDLGGYRVTLHDTAGVRAAAEGIEAVGIARTEAQARDADLVIEVTSPDTIPLGRPGALLVAHKADLGASAGLATSVGDPQSIAALRAEIGARAAASLAGAEAALVTRARQRTSLAAAAAAMRACAVAPAPELEAEDLRQARAALARVTGEIGIEEVLDAVFSRFCIGK